MRKSKNSSLLLIGALMFFLASAGFTTTTNINQKEIKQEVSSDFNLCWLCGAFGCTLQINPQFGRESCEGTNPCLLSGAVCGGPVPPGEDN